jgi:DNA-binding NtrC family response regulator
MQAKLLRVLQERRFERVGGTETVEVDVRVIAATNRGLTKLVQEEKFREDLYYRLNVIKIDLPPLRERPEDIPLLAQYFLGRYARSGTGPKQITPEAMTLLLRHRWPGNIRELENVIERACVTAREEWIGPEHLPPELSRTPKPRVLFPVDLARPLAEQVPEVVAAFEERYLRRALRKARGHLGRVARITSLSRQGVQEIMARYGIEPSQFRRE